MSAGRRLITISLVVLLLLAGGLAAFIWWGPVPISDKRVMLDFLLGRGIDSPDELNRIEAGHFYGWPQVHGFGLPDPEFGGESTGGALPTDPMHGFRPHNAPLGIHFLRSARLFPGDERIALVALHGSWNRTSPDGYKVVALHWRDDGTIEESDFLSGFLGPEGIIGRPAFVTEGPDGAIYVSDDYAGVIYRVSAAR